MVSPMKAMIAVEKDAISLFAAPVNEPEPVPLGTTGVIGEPVADAIGPTPVPPVAVPVGYGKPVPVTNPVEPETPVELHSLVRSEIETIN